MRRGRVPNKNAHGCAMVIFPTATGSQERIAPASFTVVPLIATVASDVFWILHLQLPGAT
jgi:hypothetical protein